MAAEAVFYLLFGEIGGLLYGHDVFGIDVVLDVGKRKKMVRSFYLGGCSDRLLGFIFSSPSSSFPILSSPFLHCCAQAANSANA